MDGHIFRQSSSYRQGLVLGLTMAEIMILLIFSLLITMAAFLTREQTRRQEAEQEVRVERVSSMADHNIVTAIKQNPEAWPAYNNLGNALCDEFLSGPMAVSGHAVCDRRRQQRFQAG